MLILVDTANPKNESSLHIVRGGADQHGSAEAFFAAAVRLLHESWDPAEFTERYIRDGQLTVLSGDQLRRVVAECIAITPIGDFRTAAARPTLEKTGTLVSGRRVRSYSIETVASVEIASRNRFAMAANTSTEARSSSEPCASSSRVLSSC